MPIDKKVYDTDLQTDRAKNVKGEEIYIDDAESGRKGYYCVGCDKPMQANIQKKNPNHRSYFSHVPVDVSKGEEKCTYSNREHRETIATDILQRLKRIKVPEVLKFPHKGDKRNPVLLAEAKFISAHKVRSQLTFYEDQEGKIHWGKNPEIDERYLLLRPDVTFFNEKDEPILFIELVVTHQVNDEKKIKLKRLGIDTVSIVIPRGSDQEIEDNFKSVKRVKWEYNDQEARTSYFSVSNRAPEGVLDFDEQQRRIFGESVTCRRIRINNTLRTIRKCLEGKQYREAERDFEREIYRIKEATRKAEQELASLEKYHREKAVEEASRGFSSFGREKADFEEEERRFEIEEREVEEEHFNIRDRLREQLREVQNFAAVKESIETEAGELDRRIEEVIQDREGIEDRILKGFEIENREDSSELSKRIRVILGARRVVSDFTNAKRENEKYTRAYEFFRKGTWEKG